MGKMKQKKLDKSRQYGIVQEKSELMRKEKKKDTISLCAQNELLGLIYYFLKQQGYDKCARELKSEYDRLVGRTTANEVSWKKTSMEYPSIISIFSEWTKSHKIGCKEADTISESSESSSESDASSEDMSSEESSLLTPSISSTSSEDDDSLSESEPESISKKRKRISSSVSSSGDTTSTSSLSMSSSSKDRSDTSSQRPAKRLRTNGTAISQNSESSSSDTNSADSNPSISSCQSRSKKDTEGTSATESSSDSSEISDGSDSDAVSSHSSSSESSSEQSSSESYLDKRETLNISDSRRASSSVAVKKMSKDLNVDEKSNLTGSLRLKGEKSTQRRKNSTDSSNTLLGGEGGAMVETKLAVKTGEKSPSPSVEKNVRKSQLPHKQQKANTDAFGIKQLRKDSSPFSRIPKDIKVDKRFAANLYMPNAANEQMYHDLRLTKGKGFTKEKNKKKRGSRFSGGKIDIQARETLKFDD